MANRTIFGSLVSLTFIAILTIIVNTSFAQNKSFTVSEQFALKSRMKHYDDNCPQESCFKDCKNEFRLKLESHIMSENFNLKFQKEFGLGVNEFINLNLMYAEAWGSLLANDLCDNRIQFDDLDKTIWNLIYKFRNDLLFEAPAYRDDPNAAYLGKFAKIPGMQQPVYRGPGEPCTNADFEDCNYNGWETFCGNVNNNPFEVINISAYTPGTGAGCSGSGTDQHLIITGGNDPVVGIPMVNPNGGNCSVRIGDGTGTNGMASVLRQTFLVDANSTIFTYSYAAVMEDPAHTVGEQPFFRIRMYDENNNTINCGTYQAYGGDGQPGWVTSGGVTYRNWTNVFAPLTGYVGQNITIEVATGDCSQFGHYGYAYFEASCQPMEIVTSSPFICQGQTVTLTAPPGAAQYQWSNGATGQIINVTNPGNYSVNMIPPAGPACAIQLDIDIDVFPMPTAQFIHNAPVCAGSAVTFTDQSSVGAGATITNWNWDFGNGQTSTQQNPTQVYAAAGNFNASLTVTTGHGCTHTQVVPVVINPFLDPAHNPAGPFCQGAPVHNYTATTPGGTWSATCGACINAASGAFNPNIVGTHTITYNTGGMCGGTSNSTVVVEPVFTPFFNPAGPYCEDNPVANLGGTPLGGVWSATCGACIDQSGNFNPAIAGAGNHTVTYTFAGMCGGAHSSDITVIPRSNATITPVPPMCTSSPSVVLQAAQPGGVWSANCGACIHSATGEFNPAVATAGNWVIIYTISGACGDDDQINILVEQQMDATITQVGPFCANAPAVQLTAVNTGGTWSASCGGCINSVSGVFTPSLAGPGLHTINYVIGGMCGHQHSINILVNPVADATVLPAGPFCLGFGNTAITALNAGGTWSATCGACIDPATGTFNTTVAGLGIHTVTYQIGGPCPDQKSIQVEVYPNTDASFNAQNPHCDNGNPVLFVPLNPGGNWSATCGPCITPNGFFNPAAAGAGNHTVTYTIPGVCGGSTSQVITVNPAPNVNFVADITSGCVPLTVNFSDLTAPVGVTYNWNFGYGNTQTTGGAATHTFTNIGCTDISVTVTTAEGCSNSHTIANYICVFDYAVADFTYGPDHVTIMNPVFQFVNQSSNAISYEWNFSNLGTSTAVNPSFTFPGSHPDSYLVCLSAFNVNGCHDTTCKVITVHDELILYVPNAFTPDGDGLNDVFKPVIDGADPDNYTLLIFNRWGELIFESRMIDYGWDGTFGGVNSPDGVYVWKILCRDNVTQDRKQYVGHVTLLR